MTREQVEKEMAQYRTIFTDVRLLEAAQVGSDKTLSDYCKCYDFWHKHTQCQNCISAQVLRDHTQRTKLEYMGSQVFQVTAVYREVDGQPCVMELIQQLDSETLIDPENSDRLMDSVAGYHFKLYHDALTESCRQLYPGTVAAWIFLQMRCNFALNAPRSMPGSTSRNSSPP